ncbi:hypothetical protein MJO28_007521 [Puccinia striiformis f. sp. tritici]|uniref:Uncharacterized protein n=1 Tax=Puccinia striiformis f. sp. tritici TaxID=168172 RepID=A0ACC0EHM4_9BASI|nr:hypothetical protein MJO28_007521 [Puccinia striiformis f. sp. tritici]
MRYISDLPDEVLGLILQMILSGCGPWYPETHEKKSAKPIGELRLVCRRWSDLITDRHLYRTLKIVGGHRAMQFINRQKASLRLPFSNVRPKCQVLRLDGLWACGPPPVEFDSVVTPSLLDGLIELFHDTIVDLELYFMNSFALPTSTVRAIGRISNLRILRLRYDDVDSFGDPSTGNRGISLDHNTDLFCSLLSGAQGLECLDIDMFNSLYLEDISRHALARIQLPNITHLVAGPTTSVQVAFTLAIALKPSLTMLEYDVYNGEDFRRVSEILEDTLQGLGIAHLGMLEPVSHLKFSSLRLLKIISRKGSDSDVLHMEKLSYASIEILALSACMSECEGVFKAPCLPFKRLPALRRLVFYTFDSGFSVPEDYVRLCQDHQVECLYSYASSLPELMKQYVQP